MTDAELASLLTYLSDTSLNRTERDGDHDAAAREFVVTNLAGESLRNW